MEVFIANFPELYNKLIWPLIRLMFFISLGLLAASLIESLQWNKKIARVAGPLTRLGHMPDTIATSFAMAFASGIAANTILAEGYESGKLNKKELVVGNLFNSLPTYFLHLPTMFFITLPLIQSAAFIYIGLTFGAAVLRTFLMVLISRIILPAVDFSSASQQVEEKFTIRERAQQIARRFKQRILKIAKFTIPIYICVYFMYRIGAFRELELFFAKYLEAFPFLTPQSMGIITLHLAAELTAGLAAAGALLQEGTLNAQQVVIALLIGNIISSPVRAIRHQLPYYSGIFSPKLAVEIIIYSQSFRVGSLLLITSCYIAYNAPY